MLLQKIMNKVRYLLRDKDFKSDIAITDVSCEILYTNAFDEYDNLGISYVLSSIYTLYRFENNGNLSKSFNHFCNVLNMYGFRYIIHEDDKETILIVEGSLADYDELISLYYDEELSANNDPFMSITISQLRYLPSDYFNNVEYTEDWEKSYLNFNYYAGNNYKSIVRSNEKPDLITLVEKDIVTSASDSDEEINDLKRSIECIYLAILLDEDDYLLSSDTNSLISFSDSYHIFRTRSGNHIAIIKIRINPLLQYMNMYEDNDICIAISEIEELDIYKDIKEEKSNDDYYKDIDEIIEV